MAVTLTVNNIPFDYPEQGEQAPWGEAATGWAKEVTNVLSTLQGSSDIIETYFNISGTQTTATNITGLSFDPTTVRAFIVQGSISRPFTSGTIYEQFTLSGLNQEASWILEQEGIGDAKVNLSITSGGQIQYSINISETFVGTGTIRFRGIGILK